MSISRRMSKQYNGLFTKFLITQLDTETLKPFIAFKWIPKGTSDSKDEADENKVQQFCFPESTSVLESLLKTVTTEQIDFFSFILTNSYGGKSFAYCKRIMKEEPVCYVFISTKPYFNLFNQVFTVVETKFERKVKYSINALLNSLLVFPINRTLSQTEIKASANNSQTENYEFLYITPASDFEHISYEPIYNMKVAHIMKIFEALLCESRVILCSSSISKVSNSILAISSLIYPFSWQHIFISILPESLMPYVAAPIPFLIGILESSLKSFYQQPTEQVLLYNLDKCEFMIDPNFKSLIPVHISNYLEGSLKKIRTELTTYDSGYDRVIRKPFLSVIYHLFQNYPTFMLKNGVSYSFSKDQFIDSHSGSTKKFLETLVCSQMIEMFFNEKEEEASKSDDLSCSFLTDHRDYVDKIPQISSKRQSVLDCPICMESTNARGSIEFANYLMHKDCFRCKTCGNGLMDLEREKVILKRKDGERIQLYCADCRSSTFLNKLKSTSNQSKQKIYNFFKSDDPNSYFFSSPAISYNQSKDAANRGVNISNPMPIYQTNNNHPVLPVKSEIQNFKFKKPPPKDLGGKSLSLGKFHPHHYGNEKASTLPAPINMSGLVRSNGNQPSQLYASNNNNNNNNQTSTTSTTNSFGNGSSKSSLISSSSNQLGGVNSKSKSALAIDRQKPPLPPTPDEKKERAIEQIKQKNIHIYSYDTESTHQVSSTTSQSPTSSYEDIAITLSDHHHHHHHHPSSASSSANSTPSNTPPPTNQLSLQVTQESRAIQFAKALPEPPTNQLINPKKSNGQLPPLPPLPIQNYHQSQQQQHKYPNSGRPLPIPPSDNPPLASTSSSSTVGYSPSISPSMVSPRKGYRGQSPPPIHTFVPIKKPLPVPKPTLVNDVTNNTPPLAKPTPIPPKPITKKVTTNTNNNYVPPPTNPVIIPTNNYYSNRSQQPSPPQSTHRPPSPKGTGNSGGVATKSRPTTPRKSPSPTPSASNLLVPGGGRPSKSPIASPDSSLSPRCINKHCRSCKIQLLATDQLIVSSGAYFHYKCFDKHTNINNDNNTNSNNNNTTTSDLQTTVN